MSLETATTRPRSWWVIWPIVAVLAWIGQTPWLVAQTGITGAALGLAASLPITAVIVLTFLWLNRWARGRTPLLVSAFVWGSCFATLGAIWSQQWLHDLANTIWGTDVGAWIRPLIITPVTEELLKALFLIWLLVYRRREISGVLDAVVYAGLVGVGFSFTENILYLGRPLSEALASGGTDPSAVSTLGVTLIMRVLMVPFFHSLMVALTGLGVGLAANYSRRGTRALPVVLGVLPAIVLHGVWDWAGIASSDRFLIFKIYGAVMVPIFVAVFVTALVLRRRQGRTIAAGVATLVTHGDIASADGALLGSLGQRRRWRRDIRKGAGRAAARATGRYQAEASRLSIRVVSGRRGDRDFVDEQRRVTARERAAAAAAEPLAA